MKILVLSDEENKGLWDFFTKDRLDGVDLILSCGDLDADYLSFLATMSTKAPLLYVHGNHDHYIEGKGPGGCICIEDDVYEYKGLRILGLGGSPLYNGGPHQYTEQEMKRRIRRFSLRLKMKKGVDILLTHAPARGVNDADDPVHRGFEAFLAILDQYSPAYHIHGHVHLNYGRRIKRVTDYRSTVVVNACGSYYLDIDEERLSGRKGSR